ncbi:hypothetical protein BDY21DRAFT_353212 [Lineolata rhizophorae]|uniref:Uncharacterized protein n=1 Tax=Lineolata rhizophorae TaxID=578093 RepID=A0A6A6NSK7_9PEZI|nr:hypothetical protein BDY21DRAFT_353212 [Lineolata rhizophorae]
MFVKILQASLGSYDLANSRHLKALRLKAGCRPGRRDAPARLRVPRYRSGLAASRARHWRRR